MSSNVITNAWDTIQARYRSSPLPAFLGWWRGELASLIPDGLRRRMVSPRPAIWLVLDGPGEKLALWRGGEQPASLGELLIADDLQVLRQRWMAALEAFEDGVPEVRLCLPAERVLACPVEQPLAIEANLGKALGYQLDQFTPFRAVDVMFDHRVKDRNTETGRLAVDVRLVPKAQISDLLGRLNDIGIVPHAIDTLIEGGETPSTEGFNLIPEGQRPGYVYARARLNWVLAGVAVLVLGAVMAQSLYLRNNTVDSLRSEVDALRFQADQVMALQRQLEDSLQAANFLAERRRRQPVVIHVLDEVSRVLPDDMWINQLQVRGDELTMMGLADGSQRLIEIINASPLLDDTQFRGAINVDPATGKERFNALAQITRGGASDAAAAGPGE
ncbi:MAG: PilN domain-containing protein [Pseudomonadota bacterium]